MNFFPELLNRFSHDIAIDLGTANIRLLVKGEDEIISEPSIVVLNNTQKVLAVGNSAREMIGRTPSTIKAVQPLKNGVISDFVSTEALIKHFIKEAQKKKKTLSKLLRPRVIVAVPSLITEVEIKAVIDAVKSAGGRKVYIVEEPMAAAIGSGLPIERASGSMIVDIGGGTTDIAVISLGEIVVDNTLRVAGDKMDQAIVDYVRNKYNLLIGIKMAEDVKVKLASANPVVKDEVMLVKGQDILTGLPKSIDITSNEVSEALRKSVDTILLSVKDALEKSPPEILSDLLSNGIVLCGGGAHIKNLDKYYSSRLKVPVVVAQEPIFCVIKGLTKLVNNIELLDTIQVKDFILK